MCELALFNKLFWASVYGVSVRKDKFDQLHCHQILTSFFQDQVQPISFWLGISKSLIFVTWIDFSKFWDGDWILENLRLGLGLGSFYFNLGMQTRFFNNSLEMFYFIRKFSFKFINCCFSFDEIDHLFLRNAFLQDFIDFLECKEWQRRRSKSAGCRLINDQWIRVWMQHE